MNAEELACELHRIGAIRFGDFILKDGRHSPFYVDLRLLIAHPAFLRRVATAMLERCQAVPYECIAGLPYAGLPLAVAMSLESGRPLVYPRKEAKAYGTKKLVEGVWKEGDRALVVDDVITTGGAKIEGIAPLRDVGLVVDDVVVLVDREQSGAATLAQAGLQLHSVGKISELLAALRASGAVAAEDVARALAFIQS